MTPPRISIPQAESLVNDQLSLNASHLESLRPGAWSTAISFEADGGRFVIRFSEHEDDFARDEFAARFSAPSLPIPRVTHRGITDGVHYAISERVAGGFLDNADSTTFRALLPSLLRTLDAMRVADTSTTTGYGSWDTHGNGMYASWPDCLARTVEDSPDFRGGSWRAKLESSPTGASAFDRDVPVFKKLLADIPNLRHVLHSDLINFNAFFQENRISGVIDWGCAMYGDFVYELAWFAFWSPWYPQWHIIDVAEEAHHFYNSVGADLHDFNHRLITYQIHIGLTHQIYNASIGGWDDLAQVTDLTTKLTDKVR